jgi:DNA-binding transcriptional LysR family regulator
MRAKPDVDPSDILLFVEVVERGGFTAAAKARGASKQSVSDRIAKLEHALGVRLLERTTRRVRLTDAGARYHARCASLAGQIAEANDEMRGLTTEPRGRLRVSVPVIFGRRYVMPVLTSLLRRHPELELEIVLADRRVDLVNEGFDVAVRVGELDDSSLVARRIGEGRLGYVASPAFLRRHPVARPSDLAGAACIGMRPRETWTLEGRRVQVSPRLVVNDLETTCEAALAGLGVARLPSFVFAPEVSARKLRELFPDAPALTEPVHVVYPSRLHLAPKVRVFVDAVAKRTAEVLG